MGTLNRVILTSERNGFPIGGKSGVMNVHIIPLIVRRRGVGRIGRLYKRRPVFAVLLFRRVGIKVIAAKDRICRKEVASGFAPIMGTGLRRTNVRMLKGMLYSSSSRVMASTVGR